MAYCLLCHYRRKHVFATENDDYIISVSIIVVVVAIQLKLEEKKRTAKCIIIKVNYTIQDAFEAREKKKSSSAVQYAWRKINAKLISRRNCSTRKFSFLLPINRSIDLNSRYVYTDVHGLLKEFKLLLCIDYRDSKRRDKKTSSFVLI